ncbi:MAG TPA: hypothetical protein VKE74_27040 [Gemmataceae bacterium]|nr:hypothetical protein [Gemmataceae bacterium]
MAVTSTRFTSGAAPCGQLVDGEHFQDQDEQCLVSDEWFYDCGCRIIQHEYHDGSISHRVIRHDGKVLTDEMDAEHHP